MDHKHAIVVVDPSSHHGEAAIDFAVEAGHRHLTAVVSRSGRAAIALEQYAASEEISVREAAEVYLEQLIHRLAARDIIATGMATDALDTAVDLASCVVGAGATLVALPAVTGHLDHDEVERASQMTGIPVVLVPIPIAV